MNLWIDDVRPAPANWAGNCITVTNSVAAIYMLELWHIKDARFECISFDHDLGGDDTTRPVVLWLAVNDAWPAKCYVHTMNPVGRAWLVGMLERYGPGVSL
jgi:hypothetical protein